MDTIALLKLLETSGLGNVLSDVLGSKNNMEKVKLEFIKILLGMMDKEGKCVVKDVLKKLLNTKHLFDFIGDNND